MTVKPEKRNDMYLSDVIREGVALPTQKAQVLFLNRKGFTKQEIAVLTGASAANVAWYISRERAEARAAKAKAERLRDGSECRGRYTVVEHKNQISCL